MPQGLTGVGASTDTRLVLDAGVVYRDVNATLLETATTGSAWTAAIATATPVGATRGGFAANFDRPLRTMEVDGALGPIKGFKRRAKGFAPTLQLNLLEWTTANLTAALPGSSSATAGNYDKITGGAIADADYDTNICWAGTLLGDTDVVVILLENPISTGGFSVSTSDDDEAIISITFEAHYLDTAPTTEPWAIYRPT